MINGKGPDELLDALKELDYVTNAVSVINPNECYNIKFQRLDGKLKNFSIEKNKDLTELSKQLAEAKKKNYQLINQICKIGFKPHENMWQDASNPPRKSGRYYCKVVSGTAVNYELLDYICPDVKHDKNQMQLNLNDNIVYGFQNVQDKGVVSKWMKMPTDNTPESAKDNIEEGISLQEFEEIMKDKESFDSFLERHEESQTEIHEMFDVLCYDSTSTSKTLQGKIVTNWYLISPTEPYSKEYDDDDIIQRYPMIKVECTDEEYEYLMETGICLYDEEEGDIYPFSKQSILTAGKYLDAVASFKEIANEPAGAALLIATKLLQPKLELQVMYRELTDKHGQLLHSHIKPMLGMAGKDFILPAMSDFFKGIISQVNKIDANVISRASFANEIVSVDFELLSRYQSRFTPVIRVENSYIPGVSINLSVYAKFSNNKGMMKLLNNSLYHNTKCDVSKLFEGVEDKLNEFYERIKNDPEVLIEPCDLKRLSKILGKARVANRPYMKTKRKAQNYYTAMSELMDQTFANDFGRTQKEQLCAEYLEISNKILAKV